MSICDRLVVLNFGEEIAKGSPDEVKNNRQVIQAYLGIGEHAA
jgi:branched-chain amino acid transport system ATP-binding protein